MESIVLPQVEIGTPLRDALALMRDAGRSATVATDEDGDNWLYDLPTILKGIRKKRQRFSEIQGGVLIANAGDPSFAKTLVEIARRIVREDAPGTDPLGFLSQNMAQMLALSLERIGFQFLQIPVVEAHLRGDAGPLAELVLSLTQGHRNPTATETTTLVLTEGGAYAESEPPPSGDAGERLAVFGARLAVIGARFAPQALEYCVDPAWCTCDLDDDHVFPESDYATGDECPQHHGGTLSCS